MRTMEVCNYLEVDVNGEEIFMVDKEILASFSGRFSKLFSKVTSSTRHLKVILHNFPGGADGFELMARFCYNNGTIEIPPSNIILLNFAAHFMELGSNSSAALNLVHQTEKSLERINYWTWSELVNALKQCQDLLPATNSSSLLDGIMDCIVQRLASPPDASPFTCSSDNSGSQFSCDTTSTCSTTNCFSPATWWLEDLQFLNAVLFENVIRMMISRRLDHRTIFKFLVFHLKSRLFSVTLAAEKCKIAQIAINLLSLLDRSSFSCKGLFDFLLFVSSLKKVSKCYKRKLENLIGSLLDQATLDHLLVRPPHRKNYMYDVNLVLRLVKAFLLEGMMIPSRLTQVASLMDSYLKEVAADFLLKPSKFAELALVLPDSTRESSDRLYLAIDIYLQFHAQLREEDKMRVCCAVNHEKLSAEALEHLAQNSNFPSITALKVFIAQQSKLDSLIRNHFGYLKTTSDSALLSNVKENISRQDDTDQKILVNRRKHKHLMETGNPEAELQGM